MDVATSATAATNRATIGGVRRERNLAFCTPTLPKSPAWVEPDCGGWPRTLSLRRTVHLNYLTGIGPPSLVEASFDAAHCTTSELEYRVVSRIYTRLGWPIPSPRAASLSCRESPKG